jgi:hypothetical protein
MLPSSLPSISSLCALRPAGRQRYRQVLVNSKLESVRTVARDSRLNFFTAIEGSHHGQEMYHSNKAVSIFKAQRRNRTLFGRLAKRYELAAVRDGQLYGDSAKARVSLTVRVWLDDPVVPAQEFKRGMQKTLPEVGLKGAPLLRCSKSSRRA